MTKEQIEQKYQNAIACAEKEREEALAKLQEDHRWYAYIHPDNDGLRYVGIWFVDEVGDVYEKTLIGPERAKFGNAFPLKELAEHHARIIASINNQWRMQRFPKNGETYWHPCALDLGDPIFHAFSSTWEGTSWHLVYFHMGQAFATKQDCQAWISEFGGAFTRST